MGISRGRALPPVFVNMCQQFTEIVPAAAVYPVTVLQCLRKCQESSTTFLNSITFTFYEVDRWRLRYTYEDGTPAQEEPPNDPDIAHPRHVTRKCHKVTFPRRFPIRVGKFNFAATEIQLYLCNFRWVIVSTKSIAIPQNVLEIAYGKRNYC